MDRLNRNPLDILLAEEARTCKGCRHRIIIRAWGSDLIRCDKEQQRFPKRCKLYQEGDAHAG